MRISNANENSMKIDISILEANNEKDCPPPPPLSPNPPRDDSHWLSSNTDDCPKDPPRDGSHWRVGAKN